MALLEEITWPQPLAELLEPLFEIYRQSHPWLPEDALEPKSVRARDVGAGDGLHRLRRPLPARAVRGAGAALPHRRLPRRCARPCPSAHRTPELDDVVEWLGETIRQTDSSLLDEWEALTDPDARAAATSADHAPPPPPRPISQQDRAFAVMVRNAMFARVAARARATTSTGWCGSSATAADRLDPPREVVMGRSRVGLRARGLLRRARRGPHRRRRPRSVVPPGRRGGAGRARRRPRGHDRPGTPRRADARRPGRPPRLGGRGRGRLRRQRRGRRARPSGGLPAPALRETGLPRAAMLLACQRRMERIRPECPPRCGRR